MTAHDDDQDLVTVRIPRRAAAMYAAELEVTSTSFAVHLATYCHIGAGLIALLVSLAFWIAVIVNVQDQTTSILPGAIIAGVFSSLFGMVFLFYGLRFRATLKRRSLL